VEAVVLEAILMVLGVRLVKQPISIMDLRMDKLAGMRSRETHNLEASNLRSSRGGVVVQKAGATNNSSINNIIATGDLNEFTKKKISKLTTEINSRGIVVVMAAQILRILVIWLKDLLTYFSDFLRSILLVHFFRHGIPINTRLYLNAFKAVILEITVNQ
jgi:hypothetical protein